MGLFNLLFGSRQKVTSQKSRTMELLEIDLGDRTLSIPERNFIGLYKKSPSGEWVIGWSDIDPVQRVGGHREEGHGKYILYNTIDKRLVLEGKLERPNNPHVADNGSFSIEDWHFGSELSGTFYVFSSSGEQLISKSFLANIHSSAISGHGKLAICQTANTRTGDDGNVLTAFNVEEKSELFSINPATAWADKYVFDESSNRFGVILKDLGTFFYSQEGVLANKSEYDRARIRSQNYAISISAAQEVLGSDACSKELTEEVLVAMEKAFNNGDEILKAGAMKVKGLAYEKLGADKDALLAFEMALELNPKIGLKRKVNAMRKTLLP